jgi:hypothetical protein
MIKKNHWNKELVLWKVNNIDKPLGRKSNKNRRLKLYNEKQRYINTDTTETKDYDRLSQTTTCQQTW